jgi:hypothetical protein
MNGRGGPLQHRPSCRTCCTSSYPAVINLKPHSLLSLAQPYFADFHIATFQNADGKWIARIRKADGSPLTVDLPGSTGPREYLDTDPALGEAIDAIKTAKSCIDGGSIK